MKKILSFLSFIFILICSIYAEPQVFENKTYIYAGFYDDILNPGLKFSFSKSFFYLEYPNLSGNYEESGFISNKTNSAYSISENKDFVYLKTNDEEYLILSNKIICILINLKNNICLWGIEEHQSIYLQLSPENPKHTWIGISQPSSEHFSSFLEEKINNKNMSYKRSRTSFLEITPWVEGKDSYGIGETQYCESDRDVDSIVFINGFIDPSRPDLYYKNSRIKDMVISINQNKYNITLSDTPNPQIFKLPEKNAGEFCFSIKSVYKGDKYEDTSMSGIFFLEAVP